MSGSRGETETHRDLKRRALVWAVAREFRACGVEVRLPQSGYRADVAAAMIPRGGAVEPGETMVFECKQSRADLLRDIADEEATRARLREVAARRAELEQLVGAHLPSLRRGETLFPECDSHDFSALRHDGLRALHRQESRLQSRLYAGTKFDRVRRYRCADRLYLVVAPGVMEAHEAPSAWGVLVATGDGLEQLRAPARLECDAARRLALLQAIALAGTRDQLARHGLEWEALLDERSRVVPG